MVVIFGLQSVSSYKGSSDVFFFTSSCSLHVVHGAFKTGFKSVSWDVQNWQKAMFNLFHDAPYEEVWHIKESGSFQSCKCVNVTPVFSGPEETFYHCGQGQNRHFMQVFTLIMCFAENWFRQEFNLWSLRLWLYMLW